MKGSDQISSLQGHHLLWAHCSSRDGVAHGEASGDAQVPVSGESVCADSQVPSLGALVCMMEAASFV